MIPAGQCLSGNHEVPEGTFVCRKCGAKQTLLPSPYALPYPEWVFDERIAASETERTTAMHVLDPRDGKSYVLREYLSGAPPTLRESQRFVDAAKSLRTVALPAMRVSFPCTRAGRCFTVSEPVAGVPLETLVVVGRIEAAEARLWAHDLLRALTALHSTSGAAGPLFHGDLRLRSVLVQAGSGTESHRTVVFRDSLYLENLLAPTPLTHEQAAGLDVRGVGEIVLALFLGDVPRARQRAALSAGVADVVLGSLLEFMLFPANDLRPSASRSLEYLDLLLQASASGRAADYQHAAAMHASPRLQRFASPAPAPKAKEPVAPTAYAVPPPPRPEPASTVWSPVATSRPATAATGSSTGRRRGGVGRVLDGCLVLCLLLVAIVAMVIRGCGYSPPPVVPQRALSFSVTPNPVPKGQRATVRWAAEGYNSLRLNGSPVAFHGSQTFLARHSTTYRLVATTKEGASATREVRVEVTVPPPARPGPAPEDQPEEDQPALK